MSSSPFPLPLLFPLSLQGPTSSGNCLIVSTASTSLLAYEVASSVLDASCWAERYGTAKHCPKSNTRDQKANRQTNQRDAGGRRRPPTVRDLVGRNSRETETTVVGKGRRMGWEQAFIQTVCVMYASLCSRYLLLVAAPDVAMSVLLQSHLAIRPSAAFHAQMPHPS